MYGRLRLYFSRFPGLSGGPLEWQQPGTDGTRPAGRTHAYEGRHLSMPGSYRAAAHAKVQPQGEHLK